MKELTVMDEDWRVLRSLLPPGWKVQARQLGAVERLRGFPSTEALLRTLLLHIACGYSLRETVVRAQAAGIADVSDVALMKRLRNAEAWLHELCLALLREVEIVAPVAKPGINLRVFDGTLVKEPGATGSQWRVLFSLRLPSMECDYFKLTPSTGVGMGESFRHYPVAAGDYIMADAGYSNRPGIEAISQAGAYAMVRLNYGAVPLRDAKQQPFPLIKRLKSLTPAGETATWKVFLQGTEGSIPGRLCVRRKSEQAAAQAREKLLRQARKKGKTVSADTLVRAGYVIVFTTFPEAVFTTEEILQWYRLRWQVELVFKQLKSLAGLGHLPKHDDASSRAWLYGKLLVALLTRKLIRLGRDFSPWGYVETEVHA
jgi:hypothetical protein